MLTKLYVGNLSYETTEDDLRSIFLNSGTVVSVSLIKDRDTGRSKGFAFVEMNSQSEAEQAIKDLDGKPVGSRNIKVNPARPPENNNRNTPRSYNRNGQSNPRRQKRQRNDGNSNRY
jgi:RNA recognition motif-containing protein